MNAFGSLGTMTSKERVQAFFAGAVPDRVPINYDANPGIDGRLKAHFGLHAQDGEGLRRALGVDLRYIGAPYVGPRLHDEIPDRQVDPQFGVRTRWIEHGSGGYWDFCDFPLRDADAEAVARWPMPSPDDYDYSVVPALCRENESYGLHVGHAGMLEVINSSGMVRSMEQVFVDLITGDPAWQCYVDRRLNLLLEVTRRTLEAAKGAIDFLWVGEDLGSQNKPLISMDIFRSQIRPRHQQSIDLAKSFDLPTMIHTCGSSSWAYEEFIEMGMRGVDTLQPEAKDMAPAYLKDRFGGRLVFHGCISTAGPVTFGTVDDVVRDCTEILDVMMPGGGYCLSPTHAFQDNSPTENVLAVYETAHKHGQYSA